jgi:hypothetical protein
MRGPCLDSPARLGAKVEALEASGVRESVAGVEEEDERCRLASLLERSYCVATSSASVFRSLLIQVGRNG